MPESTNDRGFPLKRFTKTAYNELKVFAAKHPERWLNPGADFDGIIRNELRITDYTEETGIVTAARPSLTAIDGVRKSNANDVQALAYKGMFQNMTPAAATDEQMWSWVTHFCLHEYSLRRWSKASNAIDRNYVRDHWFVKDGSIEALWLYNTASRPWWLAHMAEKAAEASGGAFTAREAVDDFAEHAVHYHILACKYGFSRSPEVLAAIVDALLTGAKGMKAETGLYALMKRLNIETGTVLLDALPRAKVRTLVSKHVDDIMSDPKLVADRKRLRNRKPYTCLNLGAGVQSTVLALMAERSEYGLQKPDVAIFADTGWEPQEVYEHLDWLEDQLSFRVERVSAGNVRENVLKGTQPDGKPYLGIPAHLRNTDGTTAVARRQCTDDYKIRPIQAWLRNHLNLKPGRRAPKDVQVEMWIGISVDEIIRQKDSRDEWITKVYPLIDNDFSRAQLQLWFERHYPGRYLPRSSCIGCPFKNDGEWKRLKDRDPAAFQQAVFVDEALREVPTVRDAITANGAAAYLHHSRIPLRQVDFTDATDYDQHMQDECEGVCGV